VEQLALLELILSLALSHLTEVVAAVVQILDPVLMVALVAGLAVNQQTPAVLATPHQPLQVKATMEGQVLVRLVM
jgi:hypothetical protein